MIQLRKNSERGMSQLDWLNSAHTFSFSEYRDPNFMGFGDLRVINEDDIQPGTGFARHPHHDMEIITYVVSGELEHKDSMGNGSIIRPGEIQIMSAGTGIEHSELNHSKTQLVHLLQIWIIPDQRGLKPRYQQIKIQNALNEFILIGSRNGSDSAVSIHQDVRLYVCFMQSKRVLQHKLNKNRMGWLQLIKGTLKLNGMQVEAGDGVAIIENDVDIHCEQDAEFLFFDLVRA